MLCIHDGSPPVAKIEPHLHPSHTPSLVLMEVEQQRCHQCHLSRVSTPAAIANYTHVQLISARKTLISISVHPTRGQPCKVEHKPGLACFSAFYYNALPTPVLLKAGQAILGYTCQAGKSCSCQTNLPQPSTSTPNVGGSLRTWLLTLDVITRRCFRTYFNWPTQRSLKGARVRAGTRPLWFIG